MSDGYINIEMLLNDEGFKAALAGAVNNAKGAANKTSSALAGIKKGFSIASKGALIAGAAFGSLYAVSSKLVNIYEEKEAAERRHIAVLKSMGKYTKKAVAENIAYARSLQKVTSYSDTEVLNVMNIVHTFSKIDDKLAKEATKIALDMNSALGGSGDSAKSTAIQVGKALQDKSGATALKRVGVDLDLKKVAAMTLEQYQQYVLKELKSEFGGQAEASVNPIKQAQNEMSDSMAAIGQKLTPLFAALSKALLSVVDSVSSVVGWFTNLFSSSTNIGYAIKELSVATATYNTELEKLASVDALISRYEELTAKTNLNVKEQTELNAITQKLAKSVPLAVTAFDKQGKAIGIVTEQARNYNKKMKDIAEIAFKSKLEASLSEAKKVMENYQKVLDHRYYQQNPNAGLNSNRKYNALYLNMRYNETDYSKFSMQMGQLANKYNVLYPAVFRVKEISNQYIKVVYNLAKSTGNTTLTLEKYREELNRLRPAYKTLADQMPKFNQLNDLNKVALAKFYEKHGWNWALTKKHLESLLKVQNKMRQATVAAPQQRSEGLFKKLDKLLLGLEKVGQTELQIKVSDNVMKVLDQFERLTTQDKSIIINAYLKNNNEGYLKALQTVQEKYGFNSDIINKLTKAFTAIDAQNNTSINEHIKKYKDTFKSLENSNFNFLKGMAKIEEERKDLLDKLNKWYKDSKLKITQSSGTDEQRAVETANLEQEYNKKKKDVETTAQKKQFKELSESLLKAGDSLVANISEFKNARTGVHKVRAVGNMIKQFPVFGQIIGGVINFGAGVAELFQDQIESWENWYQRQFNAMKARLDYELYAQNEILRVVKKQQQVVEFIDDLYSNNLGLSSELQLEVLEASQTSLQSYTIDGVTLGSMSDENLVDAYIEALNQQGHLEDLGQQANLTVAELIALIPDASVSNHHGFSGGWENTSGTTNIPLMLDILDKWYELVDIFSELGISPYHFYDLLDTHGTPIDDLNLNMNTFNALLENQIALNEADVEALEGLVDVNNQILEIQKQETEELENQIDLNNELSDSLKERLRALNNQSVNGLLDKLSDLEYKMSVGMIDENTGDIMRKNYMSALSNILSGLGEDTLNKEVLVTRADLMKTINNPLYDSLAGKGEIVEFHTGGQVTQSGLAALQAGEYVLRADQLGSLSSLSDNLGVLAKAGSQTAVYNTPVYISIDSVKSDDDIANIQKAVYTALDDIQNRTGAKALRFN